MSRYVCEILDEHHDLEHFDSGRPELDEWLRRWSRHSDRRDLTRTYVWHAGDDRVVAYYSLTPFVIARAALGRRQGHGLTDRVPCYLVARLALDRTLHGRGLGSAVLASALDRIAAASSTAGGRLVLVDALDDSAAAFYRHHGFVSVPGDGRRLALAIRAARRRGPS